MAHGTMIGGTAYGIAGGKTMVDGTVYDIARGKTMVDGTAYKIGFGSMAAVTLEANAYLSLASIYVYINGTRYWTADTVEVEMGSEVEVKFRTSLTSNYIYYGGSMKQYVAANTYATYTFTITTNVTITLTYNRTRSQARLTITED